ncbi:hypothetical protein BJX99DRAFT_254231 [Aspergillus californicus]
MNHHATLGCFGDTLDPEPAFFFVHPRHLNWYLVAKSCMVAPTCFAVLIWAVVLNGGSIGPSTVEISDGASHMWNMSYLLGLVMSGVAYYALTYFVPTAILTETCAFLEAQEVMEAPR